MIPSPSLSEEDRAHAQTMIERLNLNLQRLKSNRREVLERIRQDLAKIGFTRKKLGALLEAANELDHDGRLPDYAQVAVSYLEKKLRQV